MNAHVPDLGSCQTPQTPLPATAPHILTLKKSELHALIKTIARAKGQFHMAASQWQNVVEQAAFDMHPFYLGALYDELGNRQLVASFHAAVSQQRFYALATKESCTHKASLSAKPLPVTVLFKPVGDCLTSTLAVSVVSNSINKPQSIAVFFADHKEDPRGIAVFKLLQDIAKTGKAPFGETVPKKVQHAARQAVKGWEIESPPKLGRTSIFKRIRSGVFGRAYKPAFPA